METIGFYTEDELMDLLVEGAIDIVDFLKYSPQWHDIYGDYCYQRCISSEDYRSALGFMNYMELEEIASNEYAAASDEFMDEFQYGVSDYNNTTNRLNF